MANLLRWSFGLSLPKKKEENNVLATPATSLIKSLRTMNPATNNSNQANTAQAAGNNAFSRFQQINDQIRQQAEQRRQQEEQERQRRIAEQQRQQEERRQQEQARRQAEQQQQEQRQRSLLQSAGLGNSELPQTTADFRARLEAQKQAKIQKQQQETEAKNNTWKKYYDEEKQKVRDQAFKNNWGESTLQDIFNAGWDSRLAETNARNRYTSELMNQGKVEEAKKHANETMNVARQYGEQERATGRALGANYDSDVKDNPFMATFNAIRRADIGNAMVGGAEGGVADAAKFLINTGQYAIPLYNVAAGAMRGAPSVSEAIAGYGLDDKTGKYRNLSALERLGRGMSGGIDIAGPKLNASEKLAGTILNVLKGGAKNVATQGGNAAVMGLLQNALGEGIEEGVQEIGDYFGEGNTLTDENGNISGEKISEMAGRAGQAAGLGALGGGLMSGANIAINRTANAINTRRNTNVDTNITEAEVVNNDTNVNEETNVDPARVQTTQDGTMVKTNTDGTAAKLSDAELTNVIEQKSTLPTVSGTNPFINNSVNLGTSEDLNTLAKRAEQGDTYAQERLAELTGQNEEENTGWSGKSVEEVINQPQGLLESARQYGVNDSDGNLKDIQDILGRQNINARYDANVFQDNNQNAMWRIYKDENGNTVREVVFNPNASGDAIVQELAVHELAHDIFAKNTKTSEKLYQNVKQWLENDTEYQQQLNDLRNTYGDVDVEEEAVAKTLQAKLGNQEEISRLVNYEPNVARKIYDWVVDKLNKVTGGRIEKLYWEDIKNKFERAYSESGQYTNDNARMSINPTTDAEGNTLSQQQQEYFKDSKVRDSEGKLKEVYHGSYGGEFYTFNKDLANPESDWGKGFYATDNIYDVQENYEGGGPDFENKVSRLAEQIEQDEDISYEEAKEKAREQLDKGASLITAYADIKNPAIVGETYLFDGSEYDVKSMEDYDNIDDYYNDLIYDISDDVIADTNIDYRYKDDLMRVMSEAWYDGGMGMQDLKEKLGELYIEDYDGNLASNEVARSIVENLGFDGIIDNTVSNKFNMNIPSDTTHYIVFDSKQFKNVDNAKPTTNPDIRYDKTAGFDEYAGRRANDEDAEAEELRNTLGELYGQMEENTQVAPSYDEDLSMQKIEDVVEGKTSFDDYVGDQRELFWKSFKDSNRGGVESFLVQDPESNDYQRRISTTENGTLYRQLYQEYGGRPTKAEFNEALDDVLINGKDSKYYRGFKEFDHDGETSAFGYNKGNENIDLILDLKDDIGWVRQPSKNSTEVSSISEALTNDGNNMRKFTTVLKGVSDRVANVVKKAIGLNVKNYDHTVDNYAMAHAIKDHGNDSIPVKLSDYEKIPEIIKTADNVYWDNGETNAGKNRNGQPKNRDGVIVYEKSYGDRVVYLEEVRKGRHELAMKTMYWQEAPKNSTTDSANPHLVPDTDSLRALSRRREGANNQSVSQTAENVNQNTDVLPEDFDVKHYVTDQTKAQKERSKLPLRERISDVTAELKHYLVDDAVAYERYIKDKNERLNIREGVDRVRSSDMIARQYMIDNKLGEVVNMPEADLNEFQQYLIAKRALEVAEQGKATGRSKAADQALIDAVGDKYAKQEQIIRDYTRGMLEYSADNGLISQKLKDDLIKNNPNYVPMNRVFDVLEKKTGFKSKQLGNLSNQSVVQKMTGSERVVENPIESLMANTLRMVNEVERNNTAKLIAKSNAFHEKTLAEGEKPRPGYDTLNYMVDGKKVSYEVPELVAKEMKNLNNVLPKAAENILKVAGAPTRWLRSGATQNNPIFAVSNLLRDQMQTVVTGKVSSNLKGTKDALVATFSPTKRGKDLRAELNRAGIIGSEYRQTYGYKSGDLMAQLQADNKLSKGVKNKLKHPIDAIGDLIGRTEYFTRAQQYFGTDGDATTKAQAARNNTLNFNRAGAATRILNRIIPFLNAGVQGGRITVNSFKNRPVHTTLAIASLAGIALAAKGAAEAQDKELWDRIDESDKGQNIIIFTPNAHYDGNTNRVEGIIKIPVAQMLYPVMDATNNLKGDPSDLTMLAGDIFTATTGIEAPTEEKGFLPVVNQLTPTAVKPFLEASMNKSTYTGNEIVSEYDSNKNPEDKGAKYTTGLARTIAKATGVDAPVVDNFIQNWGGGLAKDLSKVMTDNPDNKSDGGGIGKMFENGFNRRFLSGTVESQYEIAEGLAKNYKKEVKNSEAFKSLSPEDQQKVLNAIDNDMKGIASVSTKVEQGKANDKTSLTKRQTEIVANGFNSDSYINAVTDKKATYSGSGENGAGQTLNGNVLNYGKTAVRNNAIDTNDSISKDSKSIIDKYNSMTSDDWNKYLYGKTEDSAAAEYKLALAKYENDLANGKINDAQKVKKEKELAKLAVSQKWTKDYRDAYGLAGTKADMQAYLNGLDAETREKTVSTLNGLNNAMYEAGIISASTYKTRYNAINNTTSKKSGGRKRSSGKSSKSEGISSAEASALASLAKTMTKGDDGVKIKTPEAPETKRKMSKTKSSGNKTGLVTYTPSSKKSISVSKGAKRSIA